MPVPPEVRARIAESREIPRSAAALAALALDVGWNVQTTYARGTLPGLRSKDRVVDSIAVRALHPNGALVALWLDGKFWRGLSRSRTYNLSEFKNELRATT